MSSSHNEATSPLNSTRNWQSPGRRQATGTPIHRSLSIQSLDRHYPPAVPSPSPRDITAQDQSAPESVRLLSRPPVSPITREPRQRTARRDRHQSKHGHDQRTLNPLGKSEQSTSNNLDGNVSTLLTSYGESSNVKVPLTAANSTGEERLTRIDDQNGVPHDFKNTSRSIRHDGVPRLDLTDVQYSHRGPPSIRTNDSTDFKTNVW